MTFLEFRSPLASRQGFSMLVLGAMLGGLVSASALFGQKAPSKPVEDASLPYEIVDTPGSTYLLNKANGGVWRLSFTDVAGNKYWYAMHVPMQAAGTFEDFQAKLRREMAGPTK